MQSDNKNSGQWEVVGGKGNTKVKSGKGNQTNGKGGKNGESKIATLRVEDLVTPLDTKYALLNPQLRAEAKRAALGLPPDKTEQQKGKAKPAAAASKEAAKKKPSKDSKEPSKEKPPKSLPEAIRQLNVAELSKTINTIKARLPSSPLFWLKELVTTLNSSFSVDTDPTFSGKPYDYPSSLLSSDLKSIIRTTIESCGDDELSTFFEQSLIIMPSEMNRGAPVCGTKLVLQQLCFHKPTVVLSHLTRAREILTSNESRVPVTLSILWVLSQPLIKDASVGIKVWMETMLPLISMKNYNGFVAQMAEYLSTKVSNVKISLSVSEYFSLREQVQQGTSIPSSVRREVSNLVQALSDPMISIHGSKMFSKYLRMLITDASGRDEMSSNMVKCLEEDPQCYAIWQKEYRSTLVASSYFLQWIVDNDPDFARQSPDFQATLNHFQTINSSFSPTAKVPAGLSSCIQLCDALRGTSKPKKRSGSKLKSLNYLLLFALISLVYYDTRVYGEGHFAGSRLGRAAERSGVTAKVLELHQHAQPYLAQAEDIFGQLWEVTHRKGNELYQLAQPYLAQAGDGLLQIRDAVYRKGEELYPGVWAEADKRYQDALVTLKEKSVMALAIANQYAEIAIATSVQYWENFLDWSAVYRKELVIHAGKAVEVGGEYIQRARQITVEFIEREQVQHAWKYTYDMYHKALHAVGLCSH